MSANGHNELLLAGVDAGGTKCRAAICDRQGRRLGEARGGPANIATDYKTARENIINTVKAALVDAGEQRPLSEIHALLGVAGNNLGDYGKRLEGDLPFGEAVVCNDGMITHAGALGDALGAVAVLGTGSVFVARGENGYKSVGGWGFLLGDEGSGAKLGHHLFMRAIHAEDGVLAHSDLTREMLAGFDHSLARLVEHMRHQEPHEFARHAPRIFEAADAGDENARVIIDQAVKAIEAQIDATGFHEERAFSVLGGLAHLFFPRLAQKYRDCYVEPRGDALDGALSLALERWGERREG